MDAIAYFLDKNTFEIIDIVQLQEYEINIDEETNAKTTMSILKKINVSDKDFVFIKENNEITYIGVIEAPVNENNKEKYTINAKYITNMFDRKVIVKNKELISNTGIEDFIAYTIENEFLNSVDLLLNKNFIDIEVLTHTTKKFSISNENGIYNFHTFINNCTQNYNISYIFKVINGRLKIYIKNLDTVEEELIDTDVSDITDYNETFATNVIAKVTVICADGSEHNYFLLNDRTTTTDMNNENRALGDIEVIYEELAENAKQSAMNKFRSNSYSHLIEFKINSDSTLYNVKDWHIGQKIKLKNKSGDIIDTYISAITKTKGSQMWNIKTGKIRINLLDKLKQEKLR